MMSALHLIWIVPLAAMVGFITAALLAALPTAPTSDSKTARTG